MQWKKYRTLLLMLIALSMLALAAACASDEDEGDEEEGDTTETVATTKFTPSGNEGSIVGTISFEGTVPEAKAISMDADPACGQANPNAKTEEVVVNGGKLENVFVYVKDGTTGGKKITSFAFDPPANPVVLDQKGCQYTPHVVGIMAQQTLRVLNSDPTTHNVHPSPKNNQEWNQSQPAGGQPIEKKFTRAETLIPVKCNQHPWMKSYVGVLSHPLHSVSANGGKFEIKGVPAGTYTVVAWHEKLGEKTQQVAVGVKEIKTQDFSFAAAGTASLAGGGSLQVMPEIDFPMAGKH